MKQGVIDIGSNSIRLTLYAIEEGKFKILFREKNMAGLAGYVEKGALSAEGISCAIGALQEFRQTLELLEISNVAVFATASLRNISNTKEAVAAIEEAVHWPIEVLSGEDEARLGYLGAMQAQDMAQGVFVDVGGASTEVVTFADRTVCQTVSFPIGSLSLYRRCVKKILPGEGSVKRLRGVIGEELGEKNSMPKGTSGQIVGVGGTCRAVLKLIKRYYDLPQNQNRITREQLEGLCDCLCKGNKQASDLILRTEAERIHTMVPGILILRYIMEHFDSKELIVCKYGVREGYLCQKILKDTPIPRTEN